MKLTMKQEKFVQNVVSGMTQHEAYKNSYDAKNMTSKSIDEKASQTMRQVKIRTRYDELLAEHKNKALWTRERAVNELIWLQERAKEDVVNIGLKQANSNAFINTIKELNTLEDLYPKDKQGENKQDKDIAEALRGLVNGIDT